VRFRGKSSTGKGTTYLKKSMLGESVGEVTWMRF
jgi:hypothetical protein